MGGGGGGGVEVFVVGLGVLVDVGLAVLVAGGWVGVEAGLLVLGGGGLVPNLIFFGGGRVGFTPASNRVAEKDIHVLLVRGSFVGAPR